MGALHGIGNAVVVALFAGSWLLRAAAQQWQPGMWALVCSFAGVLLAAVTDWLGGELMERLGMGVDEGAGINAPVPCPGPRHGPGRPARPLPASRVSRHGAHRPK